MKRYKYTVEVEVDNDVDENDAIGGLCDIIREGLKDGSYDYIADIKVKNEERKTK